MPVPLTRRSAPQPVSGRKKALLIGINYSSTPSLASEYPPLNAPCDDARLFSKLLFDRYGYRAADVTLLVDDRDDHSLKPTRANIIREIVNLVKDAQPGDRFVFFFAGHASQIESNSFSEEDGLDEAIVPTDYEGNNLIVDNMLRKHLVDPLPDGAQLTAIFDSCHSGTLLDLDHYGCNDIWRPWISKGFRRSYSRWLLNNRKDAALFSPRIYQRRSVGPAVRARGLSVDALVSAIGPPRKVAKSASSGSRSFFTRSLHAGGSMRGRSKDDLKLRTSTGALARGPTEDDVVDIPLCLSPVAARTCTGWCEENPTSNVSVISLAACMDAQTTWEAKGYSMTQELVKILDKNPNLSIKELMTTLSFRLHTITRTLHAWSRKKKREKVVKKDSDEESATPTELVNFQDPQLGSQAKLDMDQPFTL